MPPLSAAPGGVTADRVTRRVAGLSGSAGPDRRRRSTAGSRRPRRSRPRPAGPVARGAARWRRRPSPSKRSSRPSSSSTLPDPLSVVEAVDAGLHGLRLVVRRRRRAPQRCALRPRGPRPGAAPRRRRRPSAAGRRSRSRRRAGPCMGPRRAGPERGRQVRSERAASSTVPVPSASGTNAVRWSPHAGSAADSAAGRQGRQVPEQDRDRDRPAASAASCSSPARIAALSPPPGSSTTGRPARWRSPGREVGGDHVHLPRRHGLRHGGDRVEGERVRQVGTADAGGGCSRLLAAEEPLTGTTIRQVAFVWVAHRDDRLRPGAPASTPTPPGSEDDRHTDGSAHGPDAAGTSHGEGDSVRRIRPDRQLPWSYRFVAALLRMLMQPLTRRDWRGAEHLPRGRRLRGQPQPHLLRRPARVRPLPLRQRAPAVLPGQGERLPHPRARPACSRTPSQIPVYREHPGGRGVPGRGRRGARGQVRRRSTPRAR